MLKSAAAILVLSSLTFGCLPMRYSPGSLPIASSSANDGASPPSPPVQPTSVPTVGSSSKNRTTGAIVFVGVIVVVAALAYRLEQ